MRERNYRNLKAWSAAHAFTIRIYAATRRFPDDERFGLVAQLRRCASSIAANLAEGAGRSSPAAFAHYVELAYPSANELDYHLPDDEHTTLSAAATENQKMIAALRRYLHRQPIPAGNRRVRRFTNP